MFGRSCCLMLLTYLAGTDGAALATKSPSRSPSPNSPSPAPVNQYCENALPAACNAAIVGDTTWGTYDGAPTCNNVTHESSQVWYYIDIAAGQLWASICGGATWDNKISIFTDCYGSGQCFTAGDDNCGASGLGAVATMNPAPAGRYYIMVHGFNGAAGPFTMNTQCTAPSPRPSASRTPSPRSASRSRSPRSASRSPSPRSASQSPSPSPPLLPYNEFCDYAITLQCGQTISGFMGTNYDGSPDCGILHSTPQVYYYVEAGPGLLTATTCNAATTWDTKLTIFTNCSNLACVAANDDVSGCGLASTVSTNIAKSGGYYIMVHGQTNQMGPFSLTVTCNQAVSPFTPSRSASPRSASRSRSPRSPSRSPSRLPSPSPPMPPVNQVCSGAIELTCGQTVSIDTTAAQYIGPNDCINPHDQPQVWFAINAGPGQQLFIDMCNSPAVPETFDPVVSTFSGPSCGSLTCVNSTDDGPSYCGNLPQQSTATGNGNRYYIMVYGRTDSSPPVGQAKMTVTCKTPDSPSKSPSPRTPSPSQRPASNSRSPSVRSPKSASRSRSPGVKLAFADHRVLLDNAEETAAQPATSSNATDLYPLLVLAAVGTVMAVMVVGMKVQRGAAKAPAAVEEEVHTSEEVIVSVESPVSEST